MFLILRANVEYVKAKHASQYDLSGKIIYIII
jgi:hypothetical protein